MRYEVVFAPQALEDFRRLSARARAVVRDGIEIHLRHQPAMESRSRVKRLRGVSRPQFRLRLEDYRVFYDVVENRVEILAILSKSATAAWLEQEGRNS